MKTVIKVHSRNIWESYKNKQKILGWIEFNTNGQGKQQIKNIEKKQN